MITLNEIFINNKYNPEFNNILLVIKRVKGGRRMSRPLNFDGLGLDVVYFYDDFTSDRKIKEDSKALVERLLKTSWDEFIFFQENDSLNCLLSYQFKDKITAVKLYQDGLKPYNPMKSRSYGQLKDEVNKRLWWMQNGYKADPIINSLYAYKYGFLKGVDRVCLTFPESYNNWNNKKVERIEFESSSDLLRLVRKVFKLETVTLTHAENSVFLISQTMRDDNVFERELIDYLLKSFPNRKLYLKSHPTDFKVYRAFIDEVQKRYEKVEVIDDPIPAEYFLLQLKSCIVVSTISTSMFLNNTSCRYYYTYKIARHSMKRFDRYNTENPTPHVVSVNSLDEII